MIARALTRTLLRTASGSTAIARVALPRLAPIAVQPVRAFTASRLVQSQGETDAELSGKLAQELEYEQENSNLFIGDSATKEPGFVTEFKQPGIWKIHDKAGADEVSLERDFGNERITVLFSVGDLDTSGVLEDGEDGTPMEQETEPEQPENPPFPVRISVSIVKPTGGALMVDAFTQDGQLMVDNVAYYKEKELAIRMDAEIDFQRRGYYLGPKFETLDEALQDQFLAYLAERGLDENMALFIPNYAEYKEQKEYCAWLANVRQFVDV